MDTQVRRHALSCAHDRPGWRQGEDNEDAGANASDATSGLASASCGALDTGSLGGKSTTCSATDIAGNTKTVTLAYTVTTTCSNDGYTGTQLTWCRNICEMGYTGNTQDMWLRRWIGRFHDTPYCLAEPQPVL